MTSGLGEGGLQLLSLLLLAGQLALGLAQLGLDLLLHVCVKVLLQSPRSIGTDVS
jgi:hypothetical protein